MSKWILDASALLACLNQEIGSDMVMQAIEEGALLSSVNLSESVTKLIDVGMPETLIRSMLNELGLEIIDFDSELAYQSGVFRTKTKGLGLSLGDRACLATALRFRLPVLTADQMWQQLRLDVDIRFIRSHR